MDKFQLNETLIESLRRVSIRTREVEASFEGISCRYFLQHEGANLESIRTIAEALIKFGMVGIE